MTQTEGPQAANKYTKLPAPVRLEDTITSADVVPHPEVVGEGDRERQWLLRTAAAI